MTWISTYWDLDHIVQAARLAMESAYALELANQTNASPLSNPTSVNLPTELSVGEALGNQHSASAIQTNTDVLRIAEVALSISAQTGVNPDRESIAPAKEKVTDSLEVSLSKATLTSKTLTGESATVPLSCPWTPEMEAALREFLRPLSVDLRYEYRFPDVLDEKRSIAAMNSLFKRPARPEPVHIRDDSAQLQLRRKRLHELRRSGVLDTNTKRPDRKDSK